MAVNFRNNRASQFQILKNYIVLSQNILPSQSFKAYISEWRETGGSIWNGLKGPYFIY